MKKFIKNILLVACVFVFGLVLFGCSDNNDSVLRIHIRANSNCQDDQEIKMKVKDEVVRLITPLIADCNNSNEVKNAFLRSNFISSRILKLSSIIFTKLV